MAFKGFAVFNLIDLGQNRCEAAQHGALSYQACFVLLSLKISWRVASRSTTVYPTPSLDECEDQSNVDGLPW